MPFIKVNILFMSKKVKRSDCNSTKLTLEAELSVVLYSRIDPNKLFYGYLASSIFNVNFI